MQERKDKEIQEQIMLKKDCKIKPKHFGVFIIINSEYYDKQKNLPGTLVDLKRIKQFIYTTKFKEAEI